jgi:hypothetical protein
LLSAQVFAHRVQIKIESACVLLAGLSNFFNNIQDSCQKPLRLPNSIFMSRRQAILETLLIFALFCLHGGWPVPEVNEPYYLGKAIHYWNPQWAQSDWFLQTADTHTLFYLSVGWLGRFLTPTTFAWTLRLVTWALLAWSWQRFSRAVVPRAWASLLTAALFLFLLQHYNMAGEWVVGGAEAKGFSFALVFLALEAMVEGYWNRMWLLLGAAAAFHVLVGGWAAVAAGGVWLVHSRTFRPGDSTASPASTGGPAKRLLPRACSLLAPLAAFLLSLPGLLPPLLMNRGVPRGVTVQAYKIYVFERFPHHLDPAHFWDDGFVLPFLLLIFLWLLLWPTASENPAARRLRMFVAIAICIALVGTAISLLSLKSRDLAAGWMRFYWFRLVDVAVPMGLAFSAVRWLIERKMRAAIMLLSAIAVFHAADCVVLKRLGDPPFGDRQIDGGAWRSLYLCATGKAALPPLPRQSRADKLQSFKAWLDVCGWVSDPAHTSPDARFLIPRTAYTFKWYAGRGEVVNWKETPQDAASLVAWWKRIQDIYGTGKPPPVEKYYLYLSNAGVPRLKELAQKYEADYLVTQVTVQLLPLPIAYQNVSFVVYRLK